MSILDVGEGVFEVRSTSGDTHLGGDDFDKRIVDWIAEDFLRDQGIDLRKDRQALQRLTEASEKAKIELSSTLETTISLPFITADASGPKHLETRLTRSKFDQLTADLVERCVGPVRQALADAKLTERDIQEVILVGGATRMPAVQALVRRLTGGREPNQSVNPDEVVAIGAAIQAGILSGEVKGVVLLDVTPLSLGLETLGGVMTKLLERNTTIPARKSEIFSTAEDNQTAVDIHVLRGARAGARQPHTGAFPSRGHTPGSTWQPQIEVTFDIDASGILTVSARDKTTGMEQKITISGSTQLSKKRSTAWSLMPRRIPTRTGGGAKKWKQGIPPTRWPTRSSARSGAWRAGACQCAGTGGSDDFGSPDTCEEPVRRHWTPATARRRPAADFVCAFIR